MYKSSGFIFLRTHLISLVLTLLKFQYRKKKYSKLTMVGVIGCQYIDSSEIT